MSFDFAEFIEKLKALQKKFNGAKTHTERLGYAVAMEAHFQSALKGSQEAVNLFQKRVAEELLA